MQAMNFIIYLLLMSITVVFSESEAPKAFYYISTDEGLFSHFQQLEKVWNAALSVKRSVKMLGFQCKEHFPDIPMIHLCDIFELPNNIECVYNSTVSEILNRRPCLYVSEFQPPEMIGLPKDMTRSINFDFSTVECIAGFYTLSVGRYPHERRKSILPIFTEKYVKLYRQIKKLMDFNDRPIIAAHWRRGDQLKYRCEDSTGKGLDHSVNCKGVKELLIEIQNNREIYASHLDDPLIYVATNEQNPKLLDHIKAANYLVMDDIANHQKVKSLKLNKLDLFLIEVMLMLEADLFFGWGVSSIHHYVVRYRRYKGTETILDDIAV